MTTNFKQLAVSGVQSLQPYQPGKPIDELAREFGLNEEDIIKLASNENPLGPSPKVLAAIQEALPELTRYPDGAGFELKQAISNKFGLQKEQITLGNGSSDILDFICRAFVNPGENIVTSQHAFAIYGIIATIVGAHCIKVPAINYAHDLDAMAAAINDKTRVVFVTNPNNPTGTWINKNDLINFLDKIPANVLVLLDEAYFEYVQNADYPDGLSLLPAYPNLVVARTFSKAYGLAAMRVGYGASSVEVADLLNRVRPPFNVNSLALVAATASLSDDGYVQRSIAENSKGMQQLEAAFNELNIEYIPSVANFIAFKIPSPLKAAEVFQQLLAKGVIVRPIAGYEMPDYLRVSIGTAQENQGFIEALTQVLAWVLLFRVLPLSA